MSILGLLTLFAILFAVGYGIYRFFEPAAPLEFSVIVAESQSGKSEITNSTVIPRSANQPEGIVFTYTGWLLVNDFTTGFGQQRRIFSKGDCPGLYIDSTSNSLIVAIDTFGNKETILIPNIPAKKWMHFAITVNQYSLQVYINGTLKIFHTLTQLPKQNDSKVILGPGWDGFVGRLHYYPKSLTNAEIEQLSKETPPSDGYVAPATPQYLDISWYIGRLNSS